MAKAVQQHARDLPAVLVGFFVNGAPLDSGESVSQTIEPFERYTDSERSRVGDTGFRYQSATEWDLSDELASQRAPSECAHHHGCDFVLLFPITDDAIARGGQ